LADPATGVLNASLGELPPGDSPLEFLISGEPA